MALKHYMIIGLGISIVVLGISLFLTGEEEKKPTPVAYLYISPAWADSIISELSPAEKAAQMMFFAPQQELDADSMLRLWPSYQPGGFIFNQYSFQHLQHAIQRLQDTAKVPFLMGMRQMRQGLVFPSPIALASVVSDGQINRVGEGLAEQAQSLGIQFLLTPSLNCGSFDEDLLQKSHRLYPPLAFRRILSGMEVNCPQDPAMRDTSKQFFQDLGENGLTSIVFQPPPHEQAKIPADSIIARTRRHFKGLIFVDIVDSSRIQGKWMERYLQAGADAFIVRDQLADIHSQIAAYEGRASNQVRASLRRLLLAKDWSKSGEKPALSLDSLRYIHFNRRFHQAAITLLKDDKAVIPLPDLRNKRILLLNLGEPMLRLEAFMRYYAPIERMSLDRNEAGRWENFDYKTQRYKSPVILCLNNERVDAVKDSSLVKAIYKLARLTDVIVLNFGLPSQMEAFLGLPTLLQCYEAHASVQDLAAQALMGGIPIRARFPMDLGDYIQKGQGLTRKQTRLAYDWPESVGMQTEDLSRIDSVAIYAIRKRAMPGCQVLVAKSGKVIYYKAFGHHTYRREQAVKTTDLYDIASLSKIAATTLASMKMVEQNQLRLNANLGRYFEDTFIEIPSESEGTYLSDTLSLAMYQDSLNIWRLDSLPSWEDSTLRAQLADQTSKWVKVYQDSLRVVFYPVQLSLSVSSNIFQVKIKDLLTHHSGIQPIVPILPYLNYSKRGLKKYDRYFSPTQTDSFPYQVADRMYLGKSFRDSIWNDVKHLRTYSKQMYQYSDINMVLLQWAIDSINQKGLDTYLEAAFYRDLGTQTIGFRPLERFNRKRIVPTSLDRGWRGQLLRGHVHDEVAALQGGVSGNAGLFTNANDLAILAQMLLNEGQYGDKRFLQAQTVRLFTKRSRGHRALGFDRPPGNSGYIGSRQASRKTYGHTGFTGTCMWVDPEHELVYIFLSNRVYPSRNNWRLNTYRVRQQIHDIIYESI